MTIEVRGATVRIGRSTLVDDIDLDVKEGELVAIVGPNGAGKSTLLAAIAGDRRLARGTIRLHGHDVRTASVTSLASLRAVLPQRSHLSVAFTALEVVQLVADRTLARRCLDDVGLLPFADRLYPSLSGGEQQRVQLARVLAQLALAPRAALLLDEPTSALDPRHQHLVLSLARRAASQGHATVVVLHDLTVAARWCDRIALLAGGRLVAHGAPEQILTPEYLQCAYSTTFEILRTNSGLVIVPAAA